MNNAIPDGLNVVVSSEFGTPALYYFDEGSESIYLHPKQNSFESAVSHVCGVMPDLSLQQAAQVVREHFPTLEDQS